MRDFYSIICIVKNHSNILKSLRCVFSIVCLTSCQNVPVDSIEAGNITLHFDNRIGDQNLQLNTDYTNASGETFTISKLKYYISNITLTPLVGSKFIIPP